ncbi:putative ribonuclease H-like domain-containing protein [Tanacetum coccineum]|uniref:Ribonuclease H-like domain-containing protein n=1 Tax=Tanacetum coccineum TaxID=301880 RepID=A0ABQ4WXP0_9ASTR
MESQSETTQTVSALKLPVLKTGEYDLWSMRMEQYLTFTDHALWEVIVNGDSVSPVASASAGAEGPIPPKTAEQKLARKNELKAKSTLMLAIPDEHLLKFHACKDAKSLWEAIKNRFGGNKESKKMQKTILKQNYENFAASSQEGLDKTYDRFQKLISQLEIMVKVILGGVKSEVVENTNETVNTAHNVSAASSKDQASTASYADDVMFSFFSNQSNAPQLDNEDLEQIDADDLEEMDLKWQVAMLTMRVKRFIKKIGKKLDLNDKETVGFDRIKVKCYNCIGEDEDGLTNFALMAYTSQGSSNLSTSDSELENALKEKDDLKLKLEKFETSSKNLTKLINGQISAKEKTGLGYDGQMNESDLNDIHVNESEVLDNVFDSRESDRDHNQVNDRFKKSKGYHAVFPPYIGNFIPPRAELSFAGLDDYVFKSKESETITSVHNIETTASKTNKDSLEKPKTVRSSTPLIEEWESDSEDENVFKPKKKFSQSPRGNKRNWNGLMTQRLRDGFEFKKKAYFVCESFNHLIKDCDFYENKMVEKPVVNNKRRVTGQREIRPVWNNAQRVNHQNKLTHPHPKRNFVPTIAATKSGQVPVNAAKQSSPRAVASISISRPVNTDASKPKVNDALPTTYSYFQAHSPGNPQYALQDQGIFDSGCSRHMTGNKSYLTDYQEIDGRFVAFGGSTKRGKITGKGKIRTGKLDFEDVYFVKELKFNLFSISQMCDKRNSVLFTQTECLVLSHDFKLLDESQVLLKVPRHNNMYSFDLKNVVPSGGLTRLFAKATIDESNLWHIRLGHINFKTINKLVRGSLVRGLPSKIFENDHTCVACQKRNPVSMRSINKKTYCLVVTDDFSRLSWVFFLATKDETPEILKNFITGIENQIDHKVKSIRCDNGTEFKNRIMNELCEMKGIKREFSVARTPQQNGVAERKNMTLIEAARTMLADFKLPTTFWAEAVNTACYVQNRVLCIKPRNKTPYELFLGRKPALSFMRPFGYPVIILNTLDHLGTGPNWMFDIDTLTMSMNYQPVFAGNQTNGNAGPKSSEDEVADDARKKNGVQDPAKEGDKNGQEKDIRDQEEVLGKQSEQEFKRLFGQGEAAKTNNTNRLNTVSSSVNVDTNGNNIYRMFTPVNVAGSSYENLGGSIPINDATLPNDDLLTDPLMPDLEDTTDLQDTGIFSGAYDDEDMGVEADLNNLETTMNVSLIPTTRIHKDHPKDQIIRDINSTTQIRRMTKIFEEHAMVFRKKKDKRGIVVRNKARLVAQGYTQEEGIDYDKVIAPVARIETVRAWYETLSTYLLENGFRRGIIDKTLFIKKNKGDILLVQVYVDDIIFGSTKKSLCTEFEGLMHKKFQMSSMGERTFFLGLQVMQRDDGILINQDKYVADILKKFDFATVKTASTPIETNKALLKDEEAGDIIERSIQIGLWYTRDSPFDLEAFSDSDYAGASLDRKSTTAEYVTAANCCGQVLWIQNQMLDYGFNFMNTKIYIDNESTICIVKNPVFHSKTKHIEIRHHFIRDSYEKRLIQVIKIHTDHNVVDLRTKAFDVNSDDFGVKIGSCKVIAARQDSVLPGKTKISTAGFSLLLLVTVGDNTADGV